MKDYYAALGLTRQATHEQIVQRYRELAKEYHPDKLMNNPLRHLAEEKLKEINAAFEVLGNPERRAKYDNHLRANTGYSSNAQQQSTTQQSTTGIACHRHPERPAVANCQFCGKGLCRECASLFTIVSCPECLRKNNAAYLKKVEKAVRKPLILMAAVVVIGLMMGQKIDTLFALGLYLLGVVWGWEGFKSGTLAVVASWLFLGPVAAAAGFIMLLVCGWIIGLVVGGIDYIKLLLHYRETKRRVAEAEVYIRQFTATA